MCLTGWYNKSRGKYGGRPSQSGEYYKEDSWREEEGQGERKGAAHPKFIAKLLQICHSFVKFIYQFIYKVLYEGLLYKGILNYEINIYNV